VGATCRARAGSWCKAEARIRLLSKILLVALLGLLASKYGLVTKLKLMRPRFERAINLILIGLVVIYVGQLLWWLVESRQH
jgi:hypothetical protein